MGRLGGGGGDRSDESMTTAEVLEKRVGPLVNVGPRSGEWSGRAVHTRVMSDVSSSILRLAISCQMSAGWMSRLYYTSESGSTGVDVLGVRLDGSKFASQSRTSGSRRRRIT